MTEYETELRELSEFVLEVASFKEYLCSKFEKGLNLEILEKMSVFGNQDYKQVVQLALRAEKLTNERVAKGKFQKRKGFGFMSDNPRRRVEILNLQVTHLDLMQNWSTHPRQSDLHHHLDLVHHHPVLLLRLGQ